MFGAVKINDIWRRRNNSELMNLYEDVDIVSFIRLSRPRRIGHVNRMHKERKVFNIFYNQPQCTQARGRPKNRWMDYVMSDIKKSKIRNWMEQSRDRGIWRRSIMEAKARIGL
jgi:hypothetical protein